MCVRKKIRGRIPLRGIKSEQWSEKYRMSQDKNKMHLSFLSDVPTCGGGVIGEGSIKSYSFFHNMSDVPGLICM